MNRSVVGIIDYGAGNFASVWNALRQQDCKLVSITRPEQLKLCSHIVLPGVGAFSTAMAKLKEMEIDTYLSEMLRANDRPFLGICVGMQLLATSGDEFHYTVGLGVVSGTVTRFDVSTHVPSLPLPHMGWNDVEMPADSVLLKGIDPEDTSFYFVHCYQLQSQDPAARFGYTVYGQRFISEIEAGLTFGVQFHPEKSQRNGQMLLANFLKVGDA